MPISIGIIARSAAPAAAAAPAAIATNTARWAAASIHPVLHYHYPCTFWDSFSGKRCLAAVNGTVNGSSGDGGGPSSSSLAASMQWKRKQIDTLESKFTASKEEEDVDEEEKTNDDIDIMPNIESDEELQPMWRDMESRVTRRRSLTAAERGPEKVGRRNIRKSDEDVWLASGLYDKNNGDDNDDEK